MNEEEAIKLAIGFICQSIELQYCPEPSETIYMFDAAEEFLFTFRLFGEDKVGVDEYIAVSRSTGSARYIGTHGGLRIT